MKIKMTKNEMNMQKVLNGEDINVQLPNEFGEHYLEKNWTRYSKEEQLMIRKWVRFMFNPRKYINYDRTSYGLKHACESDVDFYVHNDAMKKAFLLEGYKAETSKINWCFNISGKPTLKKSEKFKEVFAEEIEKLK